MQQLIRDISASMSRNASAIRPCFYIYAFFVSTLPYKKWHKIPNCDRRPGTAACPACWAMGTKFLRVSSLLFMFPSSHLPWDFYFFKLTQPPTVSSVQLLYTVKEKGGKLDRQAYCLSYGLGNTSRNPKAENSQDYTQKPHWNCTFMNWASVLLESPFASVSLGSLGRNFTSSQIFFHPDFFRKFLFSCKVGNAEMERQAPHDTANSSQ